MKIIAVDFDITICFSNWPDLGEPNMCLIRTLKELRDNGNKLILCTCRNSVDLQRAVVWCEQQSLQFDAISENLPETFAMYGSDFRKISADYYINDRCILPQDSILCLA